MPLEHIIIYLATLLLTALAVFVGIDTRRRVIFLRFVVPVFLHASAALLLTLAYVHFSGVRYHKEALTAEYAANPRPYVYRILVPWLVHQTTRLTPSAMQGAARYASEKVRIVDETVLPLTEGGHVWYYHFLIYNLLVFLFFLGFLLCLRRLIVHFYPSLSGFSLDSAALLSIFFVVLFFSHEARVYDPSTLFLFTLGVLTIVLRRVELYYPVLVLATLNKETSVLLILLFLIFEWQRGIRDRRLAAHFVAQSALFITIKGTISYVFRNNPGSFVEFQLIAHNLALIGEPFALLRFIARLVLLGLLVGHGWSDKPLLLRLGLGATLIPLAGLTLFLGYIDEMRDYYEALPFIYLLALPTLLGILGFEVRGSAPDLDAVGRKCRIEKAVKATPTGSLSPRS